MPSLSVPESSPNPAASPETRTKATSRWPGRMRTGLLLAGLALQDAWGLALGPASVQSAMGEPLRVAIELQALGNDEAETLQAAIAAPEAFRAAELEYPPLLADLEIEIERAPGGQARLKLQGRQPVNEACIDLLLQLNWKGGQLTRRYSLLLSPAGMQMPESQSVPFPLVPAQPPTGMALPPRPASTASRARQPGAAAAPPAAPVPAGAAAPGATETATGPAPATEAAVLPAGPAEPAAPVAAASPETTLPPVAAPPVPVAAPATAARSARLLQPVWLGAALLLAGLAGLLAWRRRQQALDALAPVASHLTPAAAVQEPVAIPAAASAPAAIAAAAPHPPEAGGEIDPIAEADVYLAYGRLQQAEELLHDALRHHPESVALHLKLLELAVQRGDRPACTQLLAAVAALTDHAGPDWERAQAMLERLAPEPPASPKVQPAGFPVTPAMTPTDSTAAANPEAFDFDLPALPEPAPALQTDSADEDRGLDFDIDLGEIGRAGVETTAEADEARPVASSTAPEPGMRLDFEPEIPSDALSDLLLKEDNRDPDPLATQMELAEEFLALGDAEGARPLAERVQALATGELQSRARALLQQLDAGPH